MCDKTPVDDENNRLRYSADRRLSLLLSFRTQNSWLITSVGMEGSNEEGQKKGENGTEDRESRSAIGSCHKEKNKVVARSESKNSDVPKNVYNKTNPESYEGPVNQLKVEPISQSIKRETSASNSMTQTHLPSPGNTKSGYTSGHEGACVKESLEKVGDVSVDHRRVKYSTSGSLVGPGEGSQKIEEEESGHQQEAESATNPGVGSEETDGKESETSLSTGSAATSGESPQPTDPPEDEHRQKTEPNESFRQTKTEETGHSQEINTEEYGTHLKSETSTNPDESTQQTGTAGSATKHKSGTSTNPDESTQQTGTAGSATKHKSGTSTNPDESTQQTGTAGSATKHKSGTSTNPDESTQQTGTAGSATKHKSGTSTNPHESTQQTGTAGSATKHKSGTSTNPDESTQQTGAAGSATKHKSGTSTNPDESTQQTGTAGSATKHKSGTSTNPDESTQQIGTAGSATKHKSGTSTNPDESTQQTGTAGSATKHKSGTSTNPDESTLQTGAAGSATKHKSGTSTNPDESTQQIGTAGSAKKHKSGTSTNPDESTQQTGTAGSATKHKSGTSTNPDESTQQTGTAGSATKHKSGTSTNPHESTQQTGTAGSATKHKSGTSTNPDESTLQTGAAGSATKHKSGTSTNPDESTQQTGTAGSATKHKSGTSTNPDESTQQTGTAGSATKHKSGTSTNPDESTQQTGTAGSATKHKSGTSTNPDESTQQTGTAGSATKHKSGTSTNPDESTQQTGTAGSATKHKSGTSTNPDESTQQTGTAGSATKHKSGTSTNPDESTQQTGTGGIGSQQKPETPSNQVSKNPYTNQSREPSSGSPVHRDGRMTTSEEKMREENRANEEKMKNEGAAASEAGAANGAIQPHQDPTTKDTERPVSISICTSAYESNVRGLLTFLEDMKDVMLKDGHNLIKNVKIHELPYNNLDDYEFPANKPVDVMILCHSINNRRFAITDVMDALYDKYLPYCQRVIGKEKMGVIVHDFDNMRESVQSSRMGSFEYKQPTAFKTTSLQITCGHIETNEQVKKQMQPADRDKLINFIKDASKWPEDMKTEPSVLHRSYNILFSFMRSISSAMGSKESTGEGSSVDPIKDEGWIDLGKDQNGKTKRPADDNHSQSYDAKRSCGPPQGVSKTGTSSGSHQPAQTRPDKRKIASTKGQMQDTSNALAKTHAQGSQPKAQQSGGAAPRPISISVCSSAYEHNVQGFITKLNELKTSQPHIISDVRFRPLPYNIIDEFRFPPEDPVDVMVLCHSVNNRGFSITDVVNALYEKYLQYCHDVIGKRKVAVVVHDFSDCKPTILETRMNAFKRSQPLTFDLADTVMVCGKLDDKGNVEIRDEDWTKLIRFLEQARFEPKENNAETQGTAKSWLGSFW
ncbi:hornerin-like [Lytechinus variegatus]|uniref:hornerin-like n=1 Tax=Lytechinus variegatus TaxID=7654 RepID=UPI001BB10CC1|nr:hornerin-like [Lytechinus variegatus]